MSRYRPVAVSARDGFGHPLAIEVAARLRHNVRLLSPDGSVTGEVTVDGITFWDLPPLLPGERVASASVRQALASNGRLSASVNERGVVMCIRAEHRSKNGSTPPLARAERRHPGPTGEDFEYFERPGGWIVAVRGRAVSR